MTEPTTVVEYGLSKAWLAAEAALSEGWLIYELSQLDMAHGDPNDSSLDDEWRALAGLRWEFGDYRPNDTICEGTGPNPIAALLDLAVRLARLQGKADR